MSRCHLGRIRLRDVSQRCIEHQPGIREPATAQLTPALPPLGFRKQQDIALLAGEMQHARAELKGTVERHAHLVESGKSPQDRHQLTGLPKCECDFGRPLEHGQYLLIRVAASGDERFPEQNSGRRDRARLRGVGHSLSKPDGAARVPLGFDECTSSQRRLRGTAELCGGSAGSPASS